MEIKAEQFEQEVLKFDGLVLVDFFAQWCPPCQAMMPILAKIDEEKIVKIVKLDVDGAQDLASKYDVGSIPTLIFFKKGEVVFRNTGAVPFDFIVSKVKELNS
jgi:thioredoxin 1